MRFFDSASLFVAVGHYMLPASARLPGVRKLIDWNGHEAGPGAFDLLLPYRPTTLVGSRGDRCHAQAARDADDSSRG